LYNYQLSPQLKPSRNVRQLIISGIEDNLETEGTEQIIKKMSAQNAILNTVDITIDIKDNTRTLTLEQNNSLQKNGAVA
jgi:hypothetical protein